MLKINTEGRTTVFKSGGLLDAVYSFVYVPQNLAPVMRTVREKKELGREHRDPRRVLAVELYLENLSVLVITVDFIS